MRLFNIIAATTTFCNSAAGKKIFAYMGIIFDILKIIVPIIIIVLGSIDFIKAIIAGNDDAMKSSERKFFKRLILGICVFFVFPVVSFTMKLINQSMDNLCMLCFYKPSALTCKYDSSNTSINDTINKNNKEEKTSKTGKK